MDRESFIFHWVQGRGLMLKHQDLNAEQILDLMKMEAVRCKCNGRLCSGWRIALKGGKRENPDA